ncbi:MAG: hypothetical protein N2Z69_02465 [Methylophilaceae bacterium]|nr:hypothetical protein [Methylophilaceae bacterium]
MKAVFLLLATLLLAGCDKLTGAADQKIADAEAIGFACRVSQKSPEDCMKENEAHPPSAILDGWKTADEEIKEGKLDPAMSNIAVKKEDPASGETQKPTEGETDKKEEKPEESPKDSTKPEAGKDDKAAKVGAPKDAKAADDKDKAAH